MSLAESKFGKMPDGTDVSLFTLKNDAGMTLKVMPYGCRIVQLLVPDRNGSLGDVVLGHDTFREYLSPGNVYGAVVGRYANRIAGAEFETGGAVHRLTANEGNNSLHSGPGGFQDRLWRMRGSDGGGVPSVTFSYFSPDGECGFPGNLHVSVTYTLSADSALIIDYAAKTDRETPVNLTNHTFFNLTGSPGGKDILSEELQLNADAVTAVRSDLIPTGDLVPAEGTPYDFRKAKPIGRDIRADDPLLKHCGGYDHNFVLQEGTGIKKAGELYDRANGRLMLFFTDMPGIQVYTGNAFPENERGKGGVTHRPHHSVCLETQYFPDSVHHPEFPFSFLKPDEPYRSTTIYKFSVR